MGAPGNPDRGRSVGFSNPLGLTLAHYQHELEETLRRSGACPISLEAGLAEGETGPVGKARMLGRALRNVVAVARSTHDLNICLWPSLGLYELALHGRTRRRTAVILHDPNPITREVGYDRVVKRLVRKRSPARLPLVVVHSEEAARDAQWLVPRAEIRVLPHPIATLSTAEATRPEAPSVLVAGQYKPTRNVELLDALGPLLRAEGIEPAIVGRGWTGKVDSTWNVDDRFIPEDELDGAIERASAVLIPYHRYYQSGVAVRALELGTLPVGETNSFLTALVGDRTLPQGSDAQQYLRAVAETVAEGPGAARKAHATYQQRVDTEWVEFLDTIR